MNRRQTCNVGRGGRRGAGERSGMESNNNNNNNNNAAFPRRWRIVDCRSANDPEERQKVPPTNHANLTVNRSTAPRSYGIANKGAETSRNVRIDANVNSYGCATRFSAPRVDASMNANANTNRSANVDINANMNTNANINANARGISNRYANSVPPPVVQGRSPKRRTASVRGRGVGRGGGVGREAGRGGGGRGREFDSRGLESIRERNWNQDDKRMTTELRESSSGKDSLISYPSENSLRRPQKSGSSGFTSRSSMSSSTSSSTTTATGSTSASSSSTDSRFATRKWNFAKDLPLERPCGDVGGCAGGGRGGCWFPSESSSVFWLVICVGIWVVWSTYFETESPCVTCGWKFWNSQS